VRGAARPICHTLAEEGASKQPLMVRPSSRYILSSAPISFLQEQIKDHSETGRAPTASIPTAARPHYILIVRDLGILAIFLTDFGDGWKIFFKQHVTSRDISKSICGLWAVNNCCLHPRAEGDLLEVLAKRRRSPTVYVPSRSN
jgi:hypothetical protein